MDVFISWSEKRSEMMASNLAKHLPLMLQGVDVFMSQASIEPGMRWRFELGEWLDKSNYGLICVTPENLANPWLLFEAGALSKRLDSRVCCLLIDGLEHSHLPDPLKQFQNCHFNHDRMLEVFCAINRHQERNLGISQARDVFEKWWPDLEAGHQAAVREQVQQVEVRREEPEDMIREVLRILRAQERDKILQEVTNRKQILRDDPAAGLPDSLSQDSRNRVRRILRHAVSRGLLPTTEEKEAVLAYIDGCHAAGWHSPARNLMLSDAEFENLLAFAKIEVSPRS